MADLPPFDPPAIVRELASVPAAAGAPSLAMGLNGLADWTSEQPFIDVVKTARPWTGHLRGQWGGWGHAELAAAGVLDAEGWPTRMPPEVTSLSLLMLTDQSADAVSLGGRYRLTYRGAGDLRVVGRVANVVRRPGEIWFDYTPGPGFVEAAIHATDPADPIRDIAVVKAANIPLVEVGAVFNPDWIARVADLRAVRFMDWMATNNSPVSEWSDRPRPSDYSYGWRGAPVEVMVALADEIGADPWFTLPHKATDGYIRAFAEYVRDHLGRPHRTFVEYSNEVWNWIFGQAHWASAEARDRWGAAAGGDAWMQFAGMRAAQTAAIWDEVFGPEADDRLVTVLATQTGWLGLEEPLLEAPLWVAEDPARNRPPATYFDAYAVTGYFGHPLAAEQAPDLLRWIAESRAAAEADAAARGLAGRAYTAHVEQHRFDLAVRRAAAELADGSATGHREGSVAHLVEDLLPYQAAVAARYGLGLVMYEGGTHVVAGSEWQQDAELQSFLVQLNYSPEMAGLYDRLLAGWRAAGGTLFNAFVDVADAGRHGSWGALRHLDDFNPRWDALMRFNRETPAWWDDRPAAAFANGVTLRGTDGADEIVGTAYADTLVAGPGDDLLVAAGGSDRLHGGDGADTAILAGAASDYTLRRDGEAILADGPGESIRLVAVETIRFTDDGDAALATGDLP